VYGEVPSVTTTLKVVEAPEQIVIVSKLENVA
jgi:hypothetical protein